ncbi:MAG: alpha/beta hydrolase [Bacteroidales bacterium]|nr:alpha/beta hydrolase [Bacteroidales bacterium]
MKRTKTTIAAAATLAMLGCSPAQQGQTSPAGQDTTAVATDTIAYETVTLPSGASLLVFPSQQGKASKATVILPGGGYCFLASGHEGRDVAEWMCRDNQTAFVLLYRFPQTDPSVPNTDAREAIEYARAHAKELGQYTKVGIMGSSAGGHLASTVATHTDLVDFQVLLYPVISMKPGLTHQGSHDFLLGQNPGEEAETLYSNEKQVSRKTPRAFIALSLDDDIVPAVPNGVAYAEALARDSVPTTLVCYPRGGHGWGFSNDFEFAQQWKAELKKFLDEE